MDSQAVAAPTAASPSTQEMSSADDRPSREQFTHLAGVGITLSEAAKKYDVPRHRVHHWAVERGYVKCVDNGYPAKYDEGDIAFVVAVVHYREKAGITDTAIFNEDGTPRLELLDPYRSRWRRKHKQKTTHA